MPAGEGGQNPECWGQECLTEVIRLRGSREGNQHKVMFRKTLTVLQQKRGEPLSASVISGEELSLDSWERPGIRQSWEYEAPPHFSCASMFPALLPILSPWWPQPSW
jgi:hypothetical protein